MTIKYFSNYFGNILINGIMLIIYQKEYSFNCGKKKLDNSININKQSELYYEIIPYKPNIDSTTRYILFIIFSIIDFIIIICSNSYCGFENYGLASGVFLNCLLSYLFLGLSLEKHHIFSMVMIFIGFLIISIFYSVKENNFTSKNYLNSSFLLFQIYLEQLKKIIAYYILYKKEINIYFFLLINGVIGIIFGFIVSVVDYFFNKSFFLLEINVFNRVNFEDYCESDNNCLSPLSFFLSLSIISGLKNLSECLIYKFFYPWFFGVSIVITQFFFQLYPFNLKELPILFVLIILFFVCLIFNEQIICNFWGLNTNTKNEITKRAILEIHSILIEDDSSDEENKTNDIF